jgi:aryl-alcohol dehydrogenase-like predicted oxidoreductase/enamine deaminase RidA (YjgF/YER057c/UK114 family)
MSPNAPHEGDAPANTPTTGGLERCELAPGFSISRVLTGLWQIADMERDGSTLDVDAAARELEPYVERGFTTFDMADHYGSSELITGHYRATHPGKDVQLLTKWVPKPGRYKRDRVREAVHLALERMRSESLDLLQFHAWRYSDPGWLDCLFWLDELRQEGLIRHLGLTNFDTAHLAMVLHSGIPVISNQVCFSLLDRRPQNGMLELCEAHGVKVLGFGTVAGGLLTERWLGEPEPAIEELKTWSQMKYARFIEASGGWETFQRLLSAVNEVARKHTVSMANVACRYVLEQPGVGGIIVGARLGLSEHIDDNARLFDFRLDAEDRALLGTALEGLDPVPGDSGDEYRRPPFLTASGDLSHHFAGFPSPYQMREGVDGRQHVLTGTVWEDLAGFSRAVRQGNRILVSGTTATHRDRVIGGRDPASQMHFVIDKIEGAIQSLGGTLADVIRTRIYIRNEGDWEPISRVHGERFGDIQPTNTLVRADPIGEDYLVEMEAEAVVTAT